MRVILSDGGMTLTVTDGTYTATYGREPEAGPFTHDDAALAINLAEKRIAAAQGEGFTGWTDTRVFMVAGWRLAVHANVGKPTWWLPRVRVGKALGVGWLRLYVAVRVARP